MERAELSGLDELAAEALRCTVCAAYLPLGPRPVFRVSASARLLIIGQAPGTKVHLSGMPFDRCLGRPAARLDGHRARNVL